MWDVVRLYIRELSEVSCVDVQPLRQPLHQVRALVIGERAGGGGHAQTGGRQVRDACSYSAVKMLHFFF